MDPGDLLQRLLRSGRSSSKPPATLDELFEQEASRAWGNLRSIARKTPTSIDGPVFDWILARAGKDPGAVVATLLDLAAGDPKRRDDLSRRARDLVSLHPGKALGAAGYNLYEHNRLLDPDWLDVALKHFDAAPTSACDVAVSAAAYRTDLMTPVLVDAFAAHAEQAPLEVLKMLLSVAGNDAARSDDLLARALGLAHAHPAAFLEAASYVRSQELVLCRSLVDSVLRHLAAGPEKGWEFLEGASLNAPRLFNDATLDRIEAAAASGPGPAFSILSRLATGAWERADALDPKSRTRRIEPVLRRHRDRAATLVERFIRLMERHPSEGLDAAYYLSANLPGIYGQGLADAVARHFAAHPYRAFSILSYLVDRRPELVHERHVRAGLANIAEAANYAFGFFQALLKSRPEFAPLATLALFESLAREPGHRAANRRDMIQDIAAIAQASHVKTQLEKSLREPPSAGSRRARGLMAILFRQKLRDRQHVLFEALAHAATACRRENLNATPLWDFFLLLLDESSDDAVSTAAAERWLEGVFQLNHLIERGVDHDELLKTYAIGESPGASWPEEFRHLAGDAGLDRLLHFVQRLAPLRGSPPKLSAFQPLAERVAEAETELREVERRRVVADPALAARLRTRAESLQRRLDRWKDPAYRAALRDPAADARLPAQQAAAARRERHDLAKQLRDGLRAELSRLALASVEAQRTELYRARVKEILAVDIDTASIDPSILPAFLFFPHLRGFAGNRRHLARLVEDRIAGRPHDWMWSEPAVLAWKERVAAAFPGVVFERWRARYSREHSYKPASGEQEKRRRLKAELARIRERLGRMGIEGEGADVEALRERLAAARLDPPEAFDPALAGELEQDLERARLVANTPDSDYEGRITLEVETDPFRVLFMGEYGFASCLSLRGRNAWSAVSNAIDVDKAVVWAKEEQGNIVGRRLIALTGRGLLSYSTYANRHGLALDGMFASFLEDYAKHVGVPLVHGGDGPGPLISDAWYDDGAI